ncbi:MAG: HAMP domain-containing protein, partial [Spirochaetaceae bacterium]|nr:HAMP domain-containing protein [Spirochaetaceae bacterium]
MKTVRTRPKYALINVRGLMLIYFLLCILTILFARTFFTGILREGGMPGPLNLIIFFTIPVILVAFLTVSILSLLRDIASRRAGSRFRARLIAYFIVTVIFAAVPVTIITIQSVYMLARFWRGIEINHALDSAQAFALENYAFHLEKLEEFALNKCSAPPVPPPEAFRGTAGPMTVQDFQRGEEGLWENSALAGDPSGELGTPPGFQPGFVSREMPRDADLIRYIVFPRKDLLRVISYSLGTGFDRAIDNIANEQTRLGIIDSLRTNIRSLLILYYGVFFVPILLMTFIIAISFTRRVTQPIVELTEATRRVAEGDFSIQILSRPGDELGLLIRSFNLMVQDLEKSR